MSRHSLTTFAAFLACCLVAVTGSAATIYIGDAATFGLAVPAGAGSGNFRADTIVQLSYINSNEVASTAYVAPSNQQLKLTEVNYAAQDGGQLTPFVARYDGGATNDKGNYTLLAKGDALTSPGVGNSLGTLANQAFLVGGNNPTINANSGETIVAGWFQNDNIVVFQNVNGGGTNDRIWNNPANIVGPTAVGSSFAAGNSNFNFNLPYRFNIGFEVVEPQSAVPEPSTLLLAALGLLALGFVGWRRRKSA